MSILSGFKKIKRYIKTEAGYAKLSQWTSSQTVEMDDGSVLEDAIHSINETAGTKAPTTNPTFTGTPKAPTAAVGTNTTQIATTAFVQTAVGNGIAASDAMIIKGTIGTGGTVAALPATYKTGWTYRVVTTGTYAGQPCEIGDLVIALADRNGSGNLDADWCVAQTNINGAVTSIKSGDAYITVDQSGSSVTITHASVTRANTTSTLSPSAGGTFTAVDSITSDSKGHVTKVNTKTVTLPSTSVAVDSSLSSTSTNPVQNKAVNTALNNKLSLSGGTLTGTVYFNNGSASSGYIQPNSSDLTIVAPFSTTAEWDNTYDRRAGLVFKTCKNGILPFFPQTNLGSSSSRFGCIYTDATSTTSDKKLKTDIKTLVTESEIYNSLFDNINFVQFKWKDNNNLALETKPSSRYHYGVIAQEVEQLMHENGLTNYDNGFIHSQFFLDNETGCYITGGYRCAKEGYDYSENVWNYKHDKEYGIYNEVIEKDFAELDRGNRYKHRPKIQYILIQDISKVAAEGKQPPITINSLHFVDKQGNHVPIPLSTEGGISCYDPGDKDFKNPHSHAIANDDGSVTISFQGMWASYMIKIADDDNCFDFYDYESIIADIDFIGEYKIYLIPRGDYQTCDFWNDRDRTDETAYDYSFNYQELTNMSLAVLQQTRKDYLDYKENSESRIADLEEKVSELKQIAENDTGGKMNEKTNS